MSISAFADNGQPPSPEEMLATAGSKVSMPKSANGSTPPEEGASAIHSAEASDDRYKYLHARRRGPSPRVQTTLPFPQVSSEQALDRQDVGWGAEGPISGW